MTARISRREAERLGLTLPETTTKHRASGPYLTICARCREVFTTAASEDRHHDATGHHRYEVVFVIVA